MSEQKSSQQLAVDKLQGELKEAGKKKDFATPIIEYLVKRCGEDEGFAEDVLKKGKTWEACDKYIYDQAKKKAGSRRQIAVRNDEVFEWAEDYYRGEDKGAKTTKATGKAPASKPKQERQAKPAEVKKKASPVTKSVDKGVESDETKTDTVTKPVKEKKPEPKKKPSELYGQMSLFDLM